ncbi:hypothetical protein F2P81_009237 [Scophthalmus maximus]|uniref:Lens fiber membrane intrinsic protein-like n=1 Tax=Scophthalmus maximus TaxID=52904 RepID=A0A6A4SY78_SCOMX|nr:hypothetical protein F2P81_009237 [Scophthalmus maximus]
MPNHCFARPPRASPSLTDRRRTRRRRGGSGVGGKCAFLHAHGKVKLSWSKPRRQQTRSAYECRRIHEDHLKNCWTTSINLFLAYPNRTIWTDKRNPDHIWRAYGRITADVSVMTLSVLKVSFDSHSHIHTTPTMTVSNPECQQPHSGRRLCRHCSNDAEKTNDTQPIGSLTNNRQPCLHTRLRKKGLITYRQSSNYMHQGLWRYCMPGKCFPHSDSIAHLDATRALMILSLLACFIGIIIGIMAFIHYSSFDRFDKTFAAGMLFFISCFLVFLAMAVYTGVTINYFGKRYGNWRFSWSYIIGWVSVVLTFFSGHFHINRPDWKCDDNTVSTNYRRTRVLPQTATGAALVLCRILIPTITANLGGISR